MLAVGMERFLTTTSFQILQFLIYSSATSEFYCLNKLNGKMFSLHMTKTTATKSSLMSKIRPTRIKDWLFKSFNNKSDYNLLIFSPNKLYLCFIRNYYNVNEMRFSCYKYILKKNMKLRQPGLIPPACLSHSFITCVQLELEVAKQQGL